MLVGEPGEEKSADASGGPWGEEAGVRRRRRRCCGQGLSFL